MGSAASRVGFDSNQSASFCCLAAADYQDEVSLANVEPRTGSLSIPGEEVPYACYVEVRAPPHSPSKGLSLIKKRSASDPLKGKAQRYHNEVIGDTPILLEPTLDEVDGAKATPILVSPDIAHVLQDNGDDKYEGKVESAQSNGMEAAARIVDLDNGETASDQNPGGQPAPPWPEKAAVEGAMPVMDIHVESVREATEKVIGAAIDDVKEFQNLACLASGVDQTRSQVRALDAFSTCGCMSSTEKVTHFLKSYSTCGSTSSTEEEQSACFPQTSMDSNAESMNSQNLDGVWMVDDGETVSVVKGSDAKLPVAVVKGSDVKLLGDGADFSFQLEALGAGVWTSTMDDEELLADCWERGDGKLLLHWSNGLTWVRKADGTAIDSVSSISSSSSSSSSVSSCSSESSESSSIALSSVGPVQAGEISETLEVLGVGENAELYPAAETSKASGTIDCDDFEDQVFQMNEADKSGILGS